MMKLIQLICLASNVFGGTSIIPLEIRVESGYQKPYFNVTIAGTGRIISTWLILSSAQYGMGSDPNVPPSVGIFGRRPRNDFGVAEYFRSGLWIERDNTEADVARLVADPPALADHIPYDGQIGFGPGSDLVRYFNSVDFVRNTNNQLTASLVLNSSFEWFNSTACYSDSVISVPMRLVSVPRNEPEYRIEAQNIANYGGITLTANQTYVLSREPRLMEIDPMIFENGLEMLRQAGVVGDFESHYWRLFGTFGNCTLVRQHLPPIIIRFATGDFELHPDEYTEMVEPDLCRLAVSTILQGPFSSTEPLKLNPLAFKNLNVRFEQDQMYICDSALDRDITSVGG